MAKGSGLGDGLVVDGIDLSGDTGSLGNIGKPRPVTDVTGINKSAFERLHLLRDGGIDWSSFFNKDNAHDELSSLPTGDRIVTYMRGQSRGDRAASMVAKQLNYDPSRNQDGSLSIALQAQANGYGLEWGTQLSDGQEVFAATGQSTAVDLGGGQTLFGLQAYMQVVAFDGTDVTVTIQDSADGSTGWAAVTGAAFTAASAVGAERIQTARDETVEQHLRLDLSGTFTSVTLVVVVTKNGHEVLF